MRCYLPADEVAPASFLTGANLTISVGSGYNLILDAPATRPYTDDVYDCGASGKRWYKIWSHFTAFGDLGFAEDACPKCGDKFKVGEVLSLIVTRFQDGTPGILTVPIHSKCATLPAKKMVIKIPRLTTQYYFDEQKRAEIVPIKQKRIVRQKQIKIDKLTGMPLSWLDPSTGEFKRKRVGVEIPDFFLGEVILDTEALEEVEIEKEEIIYEEKEIEI